MKKIGLDNGTTGSLAVYDTELNIMAIHSLPTKKELSYQKEAKHITRIDFPGMCELLSRIKKGENNIHCFMEKPFNAGPRLMNTALISIRCFEAEVIALEECEIGYTVVSSKIWQKRMLIQYHCMVACLVCYVFAPGFTSYSARCICQCVASAISTFPSPFASAFIKPISESSCISAIYR